jgi:hypothetical protein
MIEPVSVKHLGRSLHYRRERMTDDTLRPTSSSLNQFLKRHPSVGRTKILEEIKSGHLRAQLCGRKLLITDKAEDEWLASLPRAGGQP